MTGTSFSPDQDVRDEPLQHYLARQLNPDTAFAFHKIKLAGKQVVLLKIAAAKNVPVSFANIRYFRIGSSKVVLTRFPERESELFQILRNGQPTLSNTEASKQDLSFEKLFIYYASRGISLNRRTFKKNLGFLLPSGKYNLLGQLLSDNSGLSIRFAIFSGIDKTSTMYSVREIGNTCLLYSLDKALELGEILNVPQADERNRVVERKEIPLFNADAYREAVINAFVHNRWTDFNSPMFCVYSDRLETISHGALPPKQTVQGFFDGISIPVNRELSDIFLQLHISERTGRGVPKIIGAYDKGIYRFGENTISLVLPFEKLKTGRLPRQSLANAQANSETPQVNCKTPQVNAQVNCETPQVNCETPQVNCETPQVNCETPQIKSSILKRTKKSPENLQSQILHFCSEPRTIVEIISHLGLKDRKGVRNRGISPLLTQGRLAMTIPDKPNSRFQKYITIK